MVKIYLLLTLLECNSHVEHGVLNGYINENGNFNVSSTVICDEGYSKFNKKEFLTKCFSNGASTILKCDANG